MTWEFLKINARQQKKTQNTKINVKQKQTSKQNTMQQQQNYT